MIQLAGCSLPASKKNPYDDLVPLPAHEGRKVIVSQAVEQVGKPYRLGGNSPREGFDCSGLAFFTYLQAGKLLPRKSEDQYLYAQKIAQAKQGDLVFFSTDSRGKRIDHVGIYIGNDLFIHAPGKNKPVTTGNLTENYWQKRYKGSGTYYE
jgi:cell wall-associated NlpC family hydrolase